MMQILPFADRRALNVYRLFERVFAVFIGPPERERPLETSFFLADFFAGFFAAAAASPAAFLIAPAWLSAVFSAEFCRRLAAAVPGSVVLLAMTVTDPGSPCPGLRRAGHDLVAPFLDDGHRVLFCAFAICRMTTSRSASPMMRRSCRTIKPNGRCVLSAYPKSFSSRAAGTARCPTWPALFQPGRVLLALMGGVREELRIRVCSGHRQFHRGRLEGRPQTSRARFSRAPIPVRIR